MRARVIAEKRDAEIGGSCCRSSRISSCPVSAGFHGLYLSLMIFDMEPGDGLELVGDQVEFRGDRAVCLSQRLVGAEANGGGQAVRAEHPRIKRDRLWVMRMPQVLPEGPGFGRTCGIRMTHSRS